ncbi:hypothetical protein APS56_01740 [Pseudalgibacter alginicilyticus]|uniref:Phosphohistidine phosphatase n=1 Tax=Pseudalgibacter alginicilyticus TaxID=1736674 RepID=A0A0P0CD72_9FLAO|nr:histidine phosphatase family protein [Pseudalgibacter alginicilyticus]ALJ03949.1 hypothetical protein APS56_01740 [Pseudalgibacter alginicilyticus]
MKRIIIVRHAKSSWKHDVIDHERPLNNRGGEDANLVSKHLKAYNVNPDLILSSDAVRAKTTAEIFISNLNFTKKKVNLIHDLYDFAGHNLLNVIKSTDNSVETLMIFGHNHALTFFANTYGSKTIENVPTSGVVVIEFAIDSWKNLESGHTSFSIFPKDLKH